MHTCILHHFLMLPVYRGNPFCSHNIERVTITHETLMGFRCCNDMTKFPSLITHPFSL